MLDLVVVLLLYHELKTFRFKDVCINITGTLSAVMGNQSALVETMSYTI